MHFLSLTQTHNHIVCVALKNQTASRFLSPTGVFFWYILWNMTLPLKTQKCYQLLIVMAFNTDCVHKGQVIHSTCQINLIKHYLLENSGFNEISFLPSILYMILDIFGLVDQALFLVFHLPIQISVLLNSFPFLETVESLLERGNECRVAVEPLQFCV
jgi:hypothetical protein